MLHDRKNGYFVKNRDGYKELLETIKNIDINKDSYNLKKDDGKIIFDIEINNEKEYEKYKKNGNLIGYAFDMLKDDIELNIKEKEVLINAHTDTDKEEEGIYRVVITKLNFK